MPGKKTIIVTTLFLLAIFVTILISLILCNKNKDLCTHRRCLFGTCSSSCKPGWSGTDCMKSVCKRDRDCLHGGKCDSKSGTCGSCASGWTGPLCDQAITTDKCASLGITCLNGGTCNKITGKCTCVGGWSGARCEIVPSPPIEEDKCVALGVTCLNGGGCDKKTGKCICTGGYTGDRCEVPQPEPEPPGPAQYVDVPSLDGTWDISQPQYSYKCLVSKSHDYCILPKFDAIQVCNNDQQCVGYLEVPDSSEWSQRGNKGMVQLIGQGQGRALAPNKCLQHQWFADSKFFKKQNAKNPPLVDCRVPVV